MKKRHWYNNTVTAEPITKESWREFCEHEDRNKIQKPLPLCFSIDQIKNMKKLLKRGDE